MDNAIRFKLVTEAEVKMQLEETGGPRGPAGPQGEQGKQGEQGQQGTPGATPNLTFEVATGPAGTDVQVEQSGTAEAPHIKLTIPRGDTGSVDGVDYYEGNPKAMGEASPGTANGVARGDHVHPMPSASDVGALGKNDPAADSAKLGGQMPSYYAKQADLDAQNEQMAALQSGVEIVPTVSGSVIALNDASNLPLRGLILHGKTTQDGTPTPDNPVELVTAENPTVRVTGKNLWPFGNMTGTAGNNVLDKAEFALPAGSYTIGANVSYPGEKKDWTIGFSDKNGVSITSITFASGNVFTLSRPSATVTLYARCEATFSNIQIEYGRSATGYEPYSGQNLAFPDVTRLPGIPVTSGGNYTDQNGQQWVCDEVDLERGIMTINVKVFSLSDVASWSLWDNNWYNHNYLLDSASPENLIYGMCSHVKRAENYYILGSLIRHSNVSGGYGKGIEIVDPKGLWGFTGSTPEELKAFIDAKNIKIVYKCKPEETKLSESELAAYRALVTSKPNTTIYNDAGCDQTVRYVADTQLYIDNKTSAAMVAQTAALEDAYAEGVASA